MPQQDAFAILAQARRMGLELASQESGAAENPNVTWKRLSLAETSVGHRDPTIQAALNTPGSPADPRWNMRLPQPPCSQCSQDHRGNRTYDHAYVHPLELQEAEAFLAQHGGEPPNQTSPLAPTPIRAGVEREIVNRVAIYDSRSGYMVTVEEPPEWETALKRRMDREQVVALLPVLRALGVRVKNLSEDEFDADQLRSDPQAAPASIGAGPRRSPEEAERVRTELLASPDAPTPEPASEHGGDGEDSAGEETGAAPRARARKAS